MNTNPSPVPTPALNDEPINILIVDDEPRNLTVLESLLDNPGYRLVRAEGAEQALLALVAEEFGLLILDINMPGMTGIELAQIIKERKKTAGVPIIFLTAYYNEEEHVVEGYGAGAVDYLLKPANPAILRSKVAVFAEMHRKNRETALANAALLREVTERRRVEEELRELTETLEQRVIERTTALEQTSAALRETGERYRSLFEGSMDAIFSLGPDGRFETANPAALRMVGHTLETVKKLRFLELCAPGQEKEAEQAFRAAFCLQCRTMETSILTAEGERRDLFISGAPAIVGDKVVGVSCIARDMTSRKQAEAERLKADQRKDEFLAMLGHELRNPLSAITNAIQLIHEAGDEPGLAEGAHGIIDRQSGNLVRIVDDLLDVSRITRGEIWLRKQIVGLEQIIARAIETTRPLLEKKGHQLILALSPPEGQPVRVEGDPTRLEQCVVNLLTNAAKFTPEGGRITVTRWQSREGAFITVSDNGIGLAPETLPFVFELFTQVDRSPDRAEGGLGIGLNICRRLIELHGGALSVHSAGLGRGTEFTLRLPVLQEAGDKSSAPPATVAAPTHGADETAVARRILVVDDNVDTARTLAKLLVRRGYEVQVAHDGPAALKAAHEWPPEVFLLDLGLPGIDGFELAQRLRADGFPSARLIAISGYAQKSDQERSRAAGFDLHFAKPLVFSELMSALREG